MARKPKYWIGLVSGTQPQHRALVRAASQKEGAALVRTSLYEFQKYWTLLDTDHPIITYNAHKLGDGPGVLADPRGANYYTADEDLEPWPFSDEVVARYGGKT